MHRPPVCGGLFFKDKQTLTATHCLHIQFPIPLFLSYKKNKPRLYAGAYTQTN